ncbi:hypothetical protein BC828DRAFT_402117 [Blastocladiella britannica]|nr:hypothetical protein BC828DRAFT_402117 [Blastocladiella britannica]
MSTVTAAPPIQSQQSRSPLKLPPLASSSAATDAAAAIPINDGSSSTPPFVSSDAPAAPLAAPTTRARILAADPAMASTTGAITTTTPLATGTVSPAPGAARNATVVDVGGASFAPTRATDAGELESYQVRALFRKTVSYQKRQKVTNICCVSACPLLMVALSALLGTLISNLIASSSTVQEFVLCSNANAYDPATNLPLTANFPTTDGRNVPGSTPGSTVKLTNFLSASGGACVMWAGNSYSNSGPYELDPFGAPLTPAQTTLFDTSTANGRLARTYARMASVVRPDPKGGWLNPLSTSVQTLVKLSGAQLYPWVMVSQASGVDLGSNVQQQPISANPATAMSAVSTLGQGNSGILGRFPTRLYTNITTSSSSPAGFGITNFAAVPYFVPQPSTVSPRDLDDSLATLVRNTLTALSSVNKAVLTQTDPDPTAQLQFQINVGTILQSLPWGAISFNKRDAANQKYEYTMQVGSDNRIARAASFPGQGLRRWVLNSWLANAIAGEDASGTTITQGLRAFPAYTTSAITLPIGAFIGRILYPFGISFLLPIFVITLVKEKEDRIQVMMVMNGLKLRTYYMAHALHFYSLHILSTVVFLVTGIAFQLQFFTQTALAVLVCLFIVWGLVQVAMAFFLGALFSKSRNALVVTFLIVLLAVIVNTAVTNLLTSNAPGLYLAWPGFAFYRALTIVNTASFTKGAMPYTMSMLVPGDEVYNCIIAMLIEIPVYLFLAYYLSSVLKSEFGVQKRWNFIFVEPYNALTGANKRRAEEDRANYVAVVNDDETQFEDADVKAERARVDANQFKTDAPLVVRHMRKIYSGTRKIAVKDVTFAAENGEVFGLLGPNGAGKTSLISILTGLYEPTLGAASLGGFDIATQRKHVFRTQGTCPQHDILWDDLSVGEHLLFYSRLKGIPPAQEEEAKDRALRAVSLENFEDRLSKGLSGGEKRRLSIAIALIGDPKVVFLDEPTTGLDPEVRRLIWTIITKARVGKTIVITTHSMEEAEVLCSRIGIMAKGTLRCIGNQLRLKQLYGAGFKLSFITAAEAMADATAKVLQLLPPSATVVDAFATSKSIEFMPEDGALAGIFDAMQTHAKEWAIDDWGLSITSLEEVFLRLVSETDAEGSAE